MNIKQLQTFVTVVQNKTLSEAASQLHFTQPAVSKHLQALERFLGTVLIERNGRELALTEQGKILYNYGVEILQLLQEAESAVQKSTDIIQGQLRVGASTIPGQYILPHHFGLFIKKYPKVEISLDVSSSEEIQKKLLNREIDIGAIGIKPKNKQINYFELALDELSLIAAPLLYKDKMLSVISIDELQSLPYISRKEGSATKQTVEERLKQVGINPSGFNKKMELGDNESIKTAVEAGLGVAFISKWAIQKELQLGTLIEIKIQDITLERLIYCIYLEQKNSCKPLELLVIHLQEIAKKCVNS